MLRNREEKARSALSGATGTWPLARTVGMSALLTLALTLIITAFVSVLGIIGSMLVSNGIVTQDTITNPLVIVGGIVVGSAVLSAIIATCVYFTFGRPLFEMTVAVNELARGNFDVRMKKQGRRYIREVDKFARSLNAAAEELAGTEMMRASFISDFSHEFRTPINSLSGFAQLVRDESLTPEERDEYLNIIVDESARLAGLSERILTLSKMEAVAIVPDVERVDVAEQIRRAVLLLEPKWSMKGVQVDLSLDECAIWGNADYLAQLWMNLLDNAVKFSPDGSSVNVALYGGRGGEEGREGARSEAVCWISDEGCGMDEQTRRRLFEKFFQGDTSHASEGSGLGLALCKRIVDLHGGTIEVQSSPGRGTVFEVRLPMAARSS